MIALRTSSTLLLVALIGLFCVVPVAFACSPGYIDTFDGSGCQPASGGAVNTGPSAGSVNTGPSAGTVKTGPSAGTGGTLQNPLKFNSLPALMDAILQAVVQLGAILLVFMLVWCGFLFVVAQGNPEKLSAARSALIWTLIGGLILLGAEAISKVVEATVTTLTP
ncbi:MAG: protein of unknown function with transrane region [Parcubacteria group bacterium]|nr:protein of unknown function with transrane region [Parcubacteria group bacterium]